MFGGHSFHILNNAIDCASYTYAPKHRQNARSIFSISDSTFVIGHVGRFSPPKNHTLLIDIFASIHKQRPDSALLLVGDGELRAQIESRVRDLGLQEHVIFTGVRSDVADLMQAMDIFVFPSLYEGLPVTMVEAQAAGLPCFISDKVPRDCVLTDLVTQIPLDASPDQWSESILCCAQTRNNTYNQLCAAGFDIKRNAHWLENYYLSR